MNKIVLITGASSGIGKATAELFRADGDKVYAVARNFETPMEHSFVCDVSDEKAVLETVEQIGKLEGRIDVLINCAGYGISGALELTPSEEALKQFQVNFFGAFYMTKSALPFMKEGGRIINISSTCALFPLPYRTLYCASKAALSMLSYGQAMECKPFGVQVCAICPGEVKTNFTKNRVKIFATNDRYGNRIVKAAEHIDRNENRRMPAQKVAEVIYKTANAKKMKPMKIVGGKYKVLYFFSRILPLSWLLKITEKHYGGHQ